MIPTGMLGLSPRHFPLILGHLEEEGQRRAKEGPSRKGNLLLSPKTDAEEGGLTF